MAFFQKVLRFLYMNKISHDALALLQLKDINVLKKDKEIPASQYQRLLGHIVAAVNMIP